MKDLLNSEINYKRFAGSRRFGGGQLHRALGSWAGETSHIRVGWIGWIVEEANDQSAENVLMRSDKTCKRFPMSYL